MAVPCTLLLFEDWIQRLHGQDPGAHRAVVSKDDRLLCSLEDVAESIFKIVGRTFGIAGAGFNDFDVVLA